MLRVDGVAAATFVVLFVEGFLSTVGSGLGLFVFGGSIPLALFLGAAAAPPTDVRTGRSVAVDKPKRTFWLSEDLSRLALQKSARELHGASGDADR